MRYFDLSEDLYSPGRWYLGMPTDRQGRRAGSWLFMQGQATSVEGPLRIPLYRPGRPLDFSMADAGTTPVVHARVASVLKTLAPADCQLFPAEVEGQTDPYFLLNATRLVKCIDDHASERVEHWAPEDHEPERVGEYRNVVGLRIDKSRVGGAHVFRPWGWTVALIVSEELKAALEGLGATGLKFAEV